MILAAGLGTRLRPLTDRTPKPLIPVAGVPMLERVARRLIAAGANRLIVNVSHLGEQVEAFLRERGGFGVEWHVSREPGAPLRSFCTTPTSLPTCRWAPCTARTS
jgi:NDP-sugar pyrophosphorylase family protein